MKSIAPVIAILLLAACQSGDGTPGSGPTHAFDAISPEETVYFTGTEPFWNGAVTEGIARYSTPENQQGTRFSVQRFAGNNGVSFTGMLGDQSFDLMVTPGRCSDGMSDREYPYTATLRMGNEQRNGCAWTDLQPTAVTDDV